MFKLTPLSTRHEYYMGDDSGYKYEIRTEYLRDRGHNATVLLRTQGSPDAEMAIRSLRLPAEHFLRQLNEHGVEPVDAPQTILLENAANALRSYALGNGSPDLAQRVAASIEAFLTEQKKIHYLHRNG